jgi:uncharacterized protein (TIGR03083 family)
MTSIEPAEYYAALTEQTAHLALAVRDADQQLPVPTCPGWTIGHLAEHVGRVHRRAAATVERQASARVDSETLEDMRIPDDAHGRVEWLHAGAARVVDAIRQTGPDSTVWTWAGMQPAMFWARRVTHETAVHRADAELALGRAFTVSPQLAADGISELFTLLSSEYLEARFAEPPIADGTRMHLHATENELGKAGEWLVHGTPSGFEWEHEHAKGEVGVRGPASGLLLVMMRRLPRSHPGVEVLGNAAVLDQWLERTTF